MRQSKFQNRELLTDVDLQTLLGVSRSTLWRLRKADRIPFAKVGRQYRYIKAEILEWLKVSRPRDRQATSPTRRRGNSAGRSRSA